MRRKSMQSPSKAYKITFIAMLIATSAILSYVENLIPLPIPFPGIKLGLSNIVLLFALYNLSLSETFFILTVRVLIIFLIFGNFMGFLISLSGGISAVFLMSFIILLSKGKISIFTVSIIGGLSHNLGQLLMASFLYKNYLLIISYYPILAIAGVITGSLIGVIYISFSRHFNY